MSAKKSGIGPLRRLLVLSFVALSAKVLVAQCREAHAESLALFKADKIPQIDITFERDGVERLRNTSHPWLDRKIGKGPMNLTETRCVKAKVTDSGKTVHAEVGVRLPGGMGSWRKVDEKPGLFLNMDKFANAQRSHGMEKVILHNAVQDRRFMKELLSGKVFQAAGMPAPRIVHAVASLNGRTLGLGYTKEGCDEGLLKDHFSNCWNPNLLTSHRRTRQR